jgi:phage baseplate assembly protein W
LPRLLFEPIGDDTFQKVQNQIISSTQLYIPEITIIDIKITPEVDRNTIYIALSYIINLSGTKDQIIIDFSTLQ